MKNLEQYKNDLNQLIETGDYLHNAIQYECMREVLPKIQTGG